MKKAHVLALERIFSSDIEQAMSKSRLRLPFQSKAKVYEELEREGMVKRTEVRVGTGWSAVTVRGWALTEAGHLAYCLSCDGEEYT